MKNKIFIVMAAFILMLAFAGCNASAGQTAAMPGTIAQTKEEPALSDAQENTMETAEEQTAAQGEAKSGADVLTSERAAAAESAGYGSEGALADKALTLQKMLTYAIQDEYLARAEYGYILKTFGNQRPFSNIIKAEEAHISELTPLFKAYGAELPKDIASERVAKAESIADALKAGEAAEVNNIAMYDAFLKQELPADVKTVFESLRKASVNHLAAFPGRRGGAKNN